MYFLEAVAVFNSATGSVFPLLEGVAGEVCFDLRTLLSLEVAAAGEAFVDLARGVLLSLFGAGFDLAKGAWLFLLETFFDLAMASSEELSRGVCFGLTKGALLSLMGAGFDVAGGTLLSFLKGASGEFGKREAGFGKGVLLSFLEGVTREA